MTLSAPEQKSVQPQISVVWGDPELMRAVEDLQKTWKLSANKPASERIMALACKMIPLNDAMNALRGRKA